MTLDWTWLGGLNIVSSSDPAGSYAVRGEDPRNWPLGERPGVQYAMDPDQDRLILLGGAGTLPLPYSHLF